MPARPPPLPAKPAHRLVAQLEASRPTAPVSPAPALDEISTARVEVPVSPSSAPRRRWVRDVAWLSVVVVAGLGALTFAYRSADTASIPEPALDPRLEAKRARAARARTALEEGHRLALKGAGHADAAIEAYRRALAEEPELAAAERGWAIVLVSQGRKAEAVKHYRRYLALKPDARDAADVRSIIDEWEKSRAARK